MGAATGAVAFFRSCGFGFQLLCCWLELFWAGEAGAPLWSLVLCTATVGQGWAVVALGVALSTGVLLEASRYLFVKLIGFLV